MANSIIDVEGIGAAAAKKLHAAGFKTTTSFLKGAKTPAMRKAMAKETGFTPKMITEWANRCDLMRVKGIGSEYSDLLEHAGVDTVKELRTRVPKNLVAKMTSVNAKKKVVRTLPTEKEVTKWVAQAAKLVDMLEY